MAGMKIAVRNLANNLLKNRYFSINHVNNSYRKLVAFTLAEVLITLLVIGVVSSLVIPGIINSTNDAEYNTGVKKIYSDLVNAMNMVQTNNSGSIVGSSGGRNIDHTAFRNEFCNVMTCAMQDASENVFGKPSYKYYKGGNWMSFTGSLDNSAVLNNGTLLYFWAYSGCGDRFVKNECGFIYADINGKKAPNMLGRDMYMFHVSSTTPANGPYSIIPAGANGDTSSCAVGGGIGCAMVRLTNPESMP